MLIARGAAEVTLLIPNEKFDDALKALLKTGAFHPKVVEGGEEGREELATIQRLLSETENLIQRVKGYLEAVREPAEPAKIEFRVLKWLEEARRVVEEAEELDSKLDPMLRTLFELRTPGSTLREAAEIARAYRWLDFDLSMLREMKYVTVKLFRIPRHNVNAFLELLKEEPIYAIVVEDAEPVYVLVITVYPPGYDSIVGDAAARCEALLVDLPENIPQNLAKAAEYFDKLEKEAEEEIRKYAPKLRELLAKLLTVRDALRAMIAARKTKHFTVLTGYVPYAKLDKVAREVVNATDGAAMIISRGYVRVEEELETPAIVTVPRFLKPFVNLMTDYGFPRPREITPLLLIAITFPLIYGMAFPDLGHGLVLLLLGLYMAKTGEFFGLARGEGVKRLGQLVVILGFSAMVFGFLAGEFFGPLPSGWLAEFWCNVAGKPPYATPLFVVHAEHLGLIEEAKASEMMTVIVYFSMYIALFLGALLLALSSLFGLYNYIATGEKYEAISAGLSKLLVFGAIFIAFLGGMAYLPDSVKALSYSVNAIIHPPLLYVILAGLAIAFVGKLYEILAHGGSIASALGNAFLELFDMIIIAFSNTVSFLRIFALALAHSGLMYGFAAMAEMAGVACPIVYILGNLLVIGLESIVAYAHTLRLHYYEMFSKFFVGLGKPFQPVKAYAIIA